MDLLPMKFVPCDGFYASKCTITNLCGIVLNIVFCEDLARCFAQQARNGQRSANDAERIQDHKVGNREPEGVVKNILDQWRNTETDTQKRTGQKIPDKHGERRQNQRLHEESEGQILFGNTDGTVDTDLLDTVHQ